jgi:hypothetical protein
MNRKSTFETDGAFICEKENKKKEKHHKSVGLCL